MKEKLKSNKAITLIALIITIIVLLILAMVSIKLIWDGGIITHAKTAVNLYTEAEIEEKIKLAYSDYQMGKFGNESYTFEQALTNAGIEYKSVTGNDEEGYVVTVETKDGDKQYKVSSSGVENATNSDEGSVKVDEIFDETGTVEGKLHIGDFVNYTAGTWTKEEIEQVERQGAKKSVAEGLPTSNFQFGGFQENTSKDENAPPHSSTFSYVEEDDGIPIKGWRVFDVCDTEITLISAGCPEDYYYPQETYGGDISEYILTGNISRTANPNVLGFGTKYVPRNWGMYVNSRMGAKSASVLSKSDLDEWYAKYVTKTATADSFKRDVYKRIYKSNSDCVNEGMYESLIDNFSWYYLATSSGYNYIYGVSPGWVSVEQINNRAMGVRVLVKLSSNVELSDKASGTKTIASRGENYIYNVWDIR